MISFVFQIGLISVVAKSVKTCGASTDGDIMNIMTLHIIYEKAH